MNEADIDLPETRIVPVASWGGIDLREVFEYRDLLYFMIWRGLKVQYAQSIGGLAWALIQPAMQIILFAVVFGGLLGLDADGRNYFLLVTLAVIPWSYMSSTLDGTSQCLVTNSALMAKVYFPRATFLLIQVFGNLVPFLVSQVITIAVMFYYQVPLTSQIFLLPVVLLLMMLVPLSIGVWLASLAIRFRDFRIAMGMVMRMLIYTVPVMYQSDKIPDDLRQWYILNPFVGVIEGFRACFLGYDYPIQWDSLLTSAVITSVLLISGSVYFRRMERVIVDVI
ncbi:MAG: ABC transporter permease [Gammaproteobacteria bacterium]|nr:ABC transporter permease [Gammaproteobacteria bacterium]MCP4088866.1 ABC transporter permease [Gammaproteobacteria bacterium]MCP4274882.1 ABC transporter permease [Gammaproteobacteria bacterium]MCP4832051.1 ABC transporter permease [Gammaproteobacteria bacterium]MCP4928348.1 ABC transporter permease [Gammaproteobacteria bacterium]